MKQYIVDAFTDKVFSGNPAAVCVLDNFPSEDIMQSIATENNLSETAFVVKENERYHIRWFTPKSEIDFCGHATLATAFVLFNYYAPDTDTLNLYGQIGKFIVHSRDDLIRMKFPAYKLEHIEITDMMIEALGTIPLAAYKDRDILFVLRDEDEVRDLQPDMELISKLDGACVAVTAKGRDYDCVSRVFAPRYGMNEDPVTGSTHCMIAPYWSRRLNKPDITAFQASKRTGILYCECIGDKVIISGKAILFSINDIVSL
ncbi:PhzF family phenazine biosynthesis protein [Ruminococcus flavefaciens]|uniref:Phenazine biosynthesis protein PhzF family n=1 Tax=Ruminococcus flavefaciens TaxID=1265 RepID=A0A1M7KJK5_RUMFL|nr:PhzF family phenazine biosynthesis isomerase [Ruminococcus flavefaciens]SHM65309.1 phenazine biosynthesis protein PhzF family [Ruminococcus flavefaciens]